MTERRTRVNRGRPDASMNSPARRRGAGPTLARLIAIRVLERVERVRAYADVSLHHALGQSILPGEDRRLATELVYGTLRWRGRLDYVIGQALDRKTKDVEPLVMTTLRLGAYQIHFSDRIPDSAAVDESVRCARSIGAERATGLVNAVLRRVARDKGSVRFPSLEDDPLAHLVHALSLPEWIATRWLRELGPDAAAALAHACNTPPPLTIRANPKRIARAELLEAMRPDFPDAHVTPLASRGIVLGRKGDPGRDARFLAGDYTVQDAASQFVGRRNTVAQLVTHSWLTRSDVLTNRFADLRANRLPLFEAALVDRDLIVRDQYRRDSFDVEQSLRQVRTFGDFLLSKVVRRFGIDGPVDVETA